VNIHHARHGRDHKVSCSGLTSWGSGDDTSGREKNRPLFLKEHLNSTKEEGNFEGLRQQRKTRKKKGLKRDLLFKGSGFRQIERAEGKADTTTISAGLKT